jgi:hypothetical protein
MEPKSSNITQVVSVDTENTEVGEGHGTISKPTGTSCTTLELLHFLFHQKPRPPKLAVQVPSSPISHRYAVINLSNLQPLPS